jgi:hypothetical protein
LRDVEQGSGMGLFMMPERWISGLGIGQSRSPSPAIVKVWPL